ncbi:mechanosensitive ion channel family protein [Candidatus Woesearchaeota archaeon]|nr:mechanosensitive ion channel family protein [Candidatus Woesearchaeota archaeon]
MAIVDAIVQFYNKLFGVGIVLDIFVAVMILLFGFLLGRFIGKLITKLLHEIELNRILRGMGIKLPVERPIGNLVSYVIYIVAVIMALNQFHITAYVLYIIVVILVVLTVLAVLLAVKDFFPNFFAGIVIYREGKFKTGDHIRVDSTEGKVVSINLLETKLESAGKDYIFIPNSTLAKSKIVVLKKKR